MRTAGCFRPLGVRPASSSPRCSRRPERTRSWFVGRQCGPSARHASGGAGHSVHGTRHRDGPCRNDLSECGLSILDPTIANSTAEGARQTGDWCLHDDRGVHRHDAGHDSIARRRPTRPRGWPDGFGVTGHPEWSNHHLVHQRHDEIASPRPHHATDHTAHPAHHAKCRARKAAGNTRP